ncbi:MAG: 7TM diverse intracellular signaling domain-containing protein [Oligoflexus sp.]
MYRHKFLLAISIISLLMISKTFASPRLTLDSQNSGQPIGRFFQLYQDPTAQLNADEVWEKRKDFIPSQSDMPNWKFTTAKTWAYIKIENPAEKIIPWILEYQYPLADRVEIYRIKDKQVLNQVYLAGDKLPTTTAPTITYRHPVFLFDLTPGEHEFLIGIETEGINRMPFAFWDQETFQHHISIDTFLSGIGFGLILVMIIYNFFITLSLRSRSYFFYILHCLCFLTFQSAQLGFIAYFKLPIKLKIWLSNWGYLIFLFSSLLFAVSFAISFLRLKNNFPKIYYFYMSIVAFIFLGLSYTIFGTNYIFSATLANSTSLIVAFSMFFTGIYFVLKRYQPAYYFSFAWGSIVAGTIILTLANFNIIPFNYFVGNASFIGGCIEMCFLSIALAARMRHFEMEHQIEREQYISRLQQKDRETQHSYKQMAKIVYPHQLSMMQRNYSLEETMPTGNSKATAIVFDIINSTQFLGPNKEVFFQEVFASCHNRMMQHYDEQNMKADAYRINELGDGFICSVGFPFTLPEGDSQHTQAITLAFDFLEIFHDINRMFYHDRHPCYCSIGIAEGDIRGFYPSTGTKEYHIFGHALVLATRYEGIRRKIFPGETASIITVQSSVINCLPENLQQKFQKFQLANDKGFKIRNDPFSKEFYYYFFRQDHELSKSS